MVLQELSSQDIKSALKTQLAELFPTLAIYTDHLPDSGIIFPSAQILILQVSRRQASKIQIRNQYDNFNYFVTIKYRVFGGTTLRPPNLLAQLDHAQYVMLSGLKSIKLNNAWHKLLNTRVESEPESGVGLMVGAFYCNIDVLIKIPHELTNLQKTLDYEIIIDSGGTITGNVP